MREHDYLGIFGAEVVTDTLAHAVNSYCIQFTEASVIAALVSDTGGKGLTGNTLVGETLAAGTIIYGHFTSLTLTSGAAIMYKNYPS